MLRDIDGREDPTEEDTRRDRVKQAVLLVLQTNVYHGERQGRMRTTQQTRADSGDIAFSFFREMRVTVRAGRWAARHSYLMLDIVVYGIRLEGIILLPAWYSSEQNNKQKARSDAHDTMKE